MAPGHWWHCIEINEQENNPPSKSRRCCSFQETLVYLHPGSAFQKSPRTQSLDIANVGTAYLTSENDIDFHLENSLKNDMLCS